jgi:hypothetical protein
VLLSFLFNYDFFFLSFFLFSRTFRILFALARGLPIIKEEWIYDSLEKGYWLNPSDYRVERYNMIDLSLKNPLQDYTFCVQRSSIPDTRDLITLITDAGGTVETDILSPEKIDFVVWGKLFVCLLVLLFQLLIFCFS